MSVDWNDFECAGHHFINGRCVSQITVDGERRDCGRAWVDIQWFNKSHTGQSGISHSGTLTDYEVSGLISKKTEWDAHWAKKFELAKS